MTKLSALYRTSKTSLGTFWTWRRDMQLYNSAPASSNTLTINCCNLETFPPDRLAVSAQWAGLLHCPLAQFATLVAAHSSRGQAARIFQAHDAHGAQGSGSCQTKCLGQQYDLASKQHSNI